MIVLRLVALFIFSALLTGCNQAPSNELARTASGEDVKAVQADIKAVKTQLEHFFPQPPCKPPDQPSPNSCYYVLEITQVIGNGQFKGKAPNDVIAQEDGDCHTNSPHPALCPTGGDKTEHGPFLVVGTTSDLQVGTVAKFDSDDSDPKSHKLKRRP